MAASSASTVLRTYEFLEHILSFLPLHDLFLVQRTCRTWQAVIRRSAALRREMFVAAAGTPLKPRADTAYNLYAGRTRALYRPAPVRLNPAADVRGLVHETVGRGSAAAPVTFGLSDQNLFLQFEIECCGPGHEERIVRAEASWRTMLVTQPPVIAINVDFTAAGWSGPVTVYNPTGVTFGELCDCSYNLAREWEGVTENDAEMSVGSMSFCLFHPFTSDNQMEEAW